MPDSDYSATGMFQFTHPVRGATIEQARGSVDTWVSIHAPRAGCDLCPTATTALRVCFNSRTPCGVRLKVNPFRLLAYQFQFTHPVRGATDLGKEIHYTAKVSIHAPRAGCDHC